jgi:hypothetical protein
MSNNKFGSVADSRPILVSGVYRSGTTFLAALLGAHPKLRSSSSTIKFIRFCLDRYGDMSIHENRKMLVEDSERRIVKRWEMKMDVHTVLKQSDAHPAPSYALMYDLMMREMLCKDTTDDVRWVEKLAVQWSGIPDFLDMFPNGRVIHIIRDPRDVTASYKHMTFEPGNTYIDAAFNCYDSMQSIVVLDEKYSDRVMLVRAEDLSIHPKGSISDLCDFLDLEYSDLMLDTDALHTKGEEWASNTSYGEKYNKWPEVNPRWPGKLSRIEVMLIELLTQPFFSNFGYKSSGYIPTTQEWTQMYEIFNDAFLKERFSQWLTHGKGAEGYRTDPYTHEMKIVFPERFTSEINK